LFRSYAQRISLHSVSGDGSGSSNAAVLTEKIVLNFTEYNTGPANCSKCDTNEYYTFPGYICSDEKDWQGGNFSWSDTTPPASGQYELVEIRLIFYGSSRCTGEQPVNALFLLQNNYISDVEIPTLCSCPNCAAKRNFTNSYNITWPYNFGGQNNLSILILDTDAIICMSELDVYLTYIEGRRVSFLNSS